VSAIVETVSPPADVSAARDALQEICACRAELETFLADDFDRWERLADGLLAGEIARGRAQEQAQREALDGQIARMAAVAADLARLLAEQKRAAPRRT
jgi:hypothetical protein